MMPLTQAPAQVPGQEEISTTQQVARILDVSLSPEEQQAAGATPHGAHWALSQAVANRIAAGYRENSPEFLDRMSEVDKIVENVPELRSRFCNQQSVNQLTSEFRSEALQRARCMFDLLVQPRTSGSGSGT